MLFKGAHYAMNIIDLIEKSMSYSIDSREQENNSLTNIGFGPIRARIKVPNQIEPTVDLLIDKVNIQSIQC